MYMFDVCIFILSVCIYSQSALFADVFAHSLEFVILLKKWILAVLSQSFGHMQSGEKFESPNIHVYSQVKQNVLISALIMQTSVFLVV